MAYLLKEVTLRTDNTEVGLKSTQELWAAVSSGKIPVLFDSDQKYQERIFPMARYSNYETDASGAYDLSIMGVTAEFMQMLEADVKSGKYRKYEAAGETTSACVETAWKQVWEETGSGKCNRAFSEDYEATVPAEYARDGQCQCSLYIAVQE